MSIYFLVKFIKIKQSKKSIILSSLFLGLAVLTKGGLYMLFPLIAGFLLVFLLFVRKESFIKCFYYVSLFVVIQLVIITGWQMRNYHATGDYTFASGKFGELALFKDHIPCLIAYQEGISKKEAKERVRKKYVTEDIMKLDVAARSKYFINVAARTILYSPLDYAVVLLKSFKTGTGPLFLGTIPPDFLFSKKKREDIFEIMQVKLYTEYHRYNNDDTTSLPTLSKREPKYMGPLSSFPLLKKLWNSNHYSYIFLWSIIKAHILLIYLTAIIGFLLILKDKSGRWVLILMVLFLAYYIALLGPVAVSRHRAILMPIFYFLSSYGLIWLGMVSCQFINSRANLIKPESLNKDNVL
jgi:hypothetical protein